MERRFAAAVIAVLVMMFAANNLFAAAYFTEVTAATKNARLFNFDTWDANIIWHATFFSDRFRGVFDKRYIEKNHLDDSDADGYLFEQGRRQAAGWDFFITMFTKKDYKKFTMDSDTFWKIHLTTETGEVLRPVEIEQVNITPYEKVMYPHIMRWSKAYRVTFPKTNLGNEFSLRMESVIGESSVKWRVTDFLEKQQVTNRMPQKYRH